MLKIRRREILIPVNSGCNESIQISKKGEVLEVSTLDRDSGEWSEWSEIPLYTLEQQDADEQEALKSKGPDNEDFKGKVL